MDRTTRIRAEAIAGAFAAVLVLAGLESVMVVKVILIAFTVCCLILAASPSLAIRLERLWTRDVEKLAQIKNFRWGETGATDNIYQPAVSPFAPYFSPAELDARKYALRDSTRDLSNEILDFASRRREGAPRHRLLDPLAGAYSAETMQIFHRDLGERVAKLIVELQNAGLITAGEIAFPISFAGIEHLGAELRMMTDRIV